MEYLAIFLLYVFALFFLGKNFITFLRNSKKCFIGIKDLRKYINPEIGYWDTYFMFDCAWGFLMGPITFVYFTFWFITSREKIIAPWRIK